MKRAFARHHRRGQITELSQPYISVIDLRSNLVATFFLFPSLNP
jgi:hypothetical protein